MVMQMHMSTSSELGAPLSEINIMAREHQQLFRCDSTVESGILTGTLSTKLSVETKEEGNVFPYTKHIPLIP